MSHSFQDRILIQYGKRPRLGYVKTRLAKSIGDENALEAHMSLVKEVNKIARKVPGCRYVFSWSESHTSNHDGFPAHNGFYEALSFDDEEHQIQGSLGDKMYQTFAKHLAKGPDSSNQTHKECSAVIIGSDCPSLDPSYIEQAFLELKDHDIVLGPAEDGGYILIGARQISPELFKNVEWGSESVRSKTIENASRLGYHVKLLDTRWDVDDVHDWQRYCSTLKE